LINGRVRQEAAKPFKAELLRVSFMLELLVEELPITSGAVSIPVSTGGFALSGLQRELQ
jgi:hypothetical protein